MNKNKSSNSIIERLTEAIKELYLNVKIKNKNENFEDFKKHELERLKEINVFNVIEYVKESIDIYVNFKIEEAKVSFDKNINLQNTEEEIYEKMIKKLEADIRNHIKVKNKIFFLIIFLKIFQKYILSQIK